jgi:hypothetical protein
VRRRLTIGVAAVSAVLTLLLVSTPFRFKAAETLPSQLSDTEYWKMISDFSEPDGLFQQDILTSNEISYQYVLPNLTGTARSGGAYLGVGPEQNFTYIAAVQPKIAFIFDIRRDMMLEHLMYKSLFEMSADRAAFVGNLFSRRLPADITANSSVAAIFEAAARVQPDAKLVDERVADILARLKTGHHFPLTADDERRIKSLYLTFVREGVVNFRSSFMSPGYSTLMNMTDRSGKNWSFLAAAENYERIRAMHQKNLIVPLVGDFAGSKAIRTTAQYLKEHGAVVNAFYISNVEDYIQREWREYVSNIASLPLDASSLFIRWSPGSTTTLASISDFLRTERPAK